MPPVLLQRHRVIATAIVLVLFAVAVVAAVMQSSTLHDEQEAVRQQAAVREAAELKADYDANATKIAASIRAALAEGRLDDAQALLRKYRPVANGGLDALASAARDKARR